MDLSLGRDGKFSFRKVRVGGRKQKVVLWPQEDMMWWVSILDQNRNSSRKCRC